MLKKTKEFISDLKREVAIYKETNEELEKMVKAFQEIIEKYKNDLQEISKLKSNTPKDCQEGEYCKSCAFANAYTVRHYESNPNGIGGCITYDAIYCNKNGGCQHFIDRNTVIKE